MTAAIALVPAAGRGDRFRGDVPKQFVEIAGKPVVLWAIERLLAAGVGRVVVAYSPDAPEEKKLQVRRGLAGRDVVEVSGGASRQESVAAALSAARAGERDFVLVHDAARPAVHPEDVRRVVAEAERSGAAVLGRAVSDTLKRLHDGRIESTVERERLFRAETPQVFRAPLLASAIEAALQDGFLGTDESSLVARLSGVAVSAVVAGHPNPKLTHPEDLAWLEYLLRS